jgi:hypothetical protein
MLKQVLKMVVVPVVLLALASPVWAGTVTSILDDPTLGGGTGAYFLPYGSSSPYNMVWQNCTGYPTNSPVLPTEPAAAYQDCLAIVNNTGANITTLQLYMTLPPGLTGDSFPCLVSASSTGFSCTETVNGGTLGLVFTGIPGFGNNTEIYIGVGASGEDVTNLGNPEVLVPTYDPSTLVLLASGMAFLAMGAFRRTA